MCPSTAAMARVVDFCPTSDDEVPDVDPSPRKLVAMAADSNSATVNESPRRQLVPKSATKSVSRKIRRLETNPKITGNLLFQRCDDIGDNNSSDHSLLIGSPRKSPLKKNRPETTWRGRKQPNDSIFESQDDSPPPTTRKSRASRLRTVSIMEDEASDNEPLPPIRMNPLLQSQGPGLRRVQLAPSRQKATRQPPKESTITSCAEQFPTIPASLEAHSKDDTSLTGEESSCRSGDGSSYSMDSFGSDSTYDESSRYTGNENSSISSSTQEAMSRSEAESNFSNDESGILSVVDPNIAGSQSTSSGAKPAPLPLAQVAVDETRDVGFQVHCDAGSDGNGLSDQLSKLLINTDGSDVENYPAGGLTLKTPPQTPSKPASSKGLASPSKLSRIPATPHRPSTDEFWDQDFVDEWNDKHSPRKLVLPPAATSPVKSSPCKAAKKAFDQDKHRIAQTFLRELDDRISDGKIFKLAESTGGVKLDWSKSLNTTAGRANWKRETIRTKAIDGTEVDVKYRHHASIELAEKVIDDENRLLNVLAHEFCHLANFMVTGITTNPHGKEFKVWASKCSRTFASRGVKVTTKHSYEIDFKYVWECSECGSDYKRHSKSIDPQRHRCGSCKGSLTQVKPVPRGGGKPSEYQIFMKEQMKIVRQENPSSPQKDIMKLVAAKWAMKPRAVSMTGNEEKPESEKEEKPESEKEEKLESGKEEKPDSGNEEQPQPDMEEEQAELEAQLAADMNGLTL